MIRRINLEDSPSQAPRFPLSAADAILQFESILNEFEKLEIHGFSNEIYYLG